MKHSELIKEAIEVFGEKNQKDKALEELTELSLAIQHESIGKSLIDHVREEIIDVQIMIHQLKLMYFDNESHFNSIYDLKIKKMLDQINRVKNLANL